MPNIFHTESTINMETVDALNRLVKSPGSLHRPLIAPPQGGFQDKRQVQPLEAGVDVESTNPEPIESLVPSTAALLSTSTTVAVLPSSSGSPQAGEDAPAAFAVSSPSPRFPANHPITKELYRLHDSIAVLHFSAVGKPWVHGAATLGWLRPDPHPLLAGQVEMWRAIARDVCPGGTEFGSPNDTTGVLQDTPGAAGVP